MPPAVVSVFLSPLDPALGAACTPEERTRATAFRAPGAADRWLAARGALRVVLASATQQDAASLRFEFAPGGKPALVDRPDVEFNASDAAGIVAVAVSSRPVGIDIEGRDRRIVSPDRLARRLFAPEALAEWGDAPASTRRERLLQAWTRTEAVLKATGAGLAGGTHDAVGRLAREGWEVRNLVDVAPVVGAVATREGDWSVSAPTWLSDQ
ncbi:MAG: 4'-phosphopantetheinyl transferase family protein [Acidimicrobiales bacterium]